MANKRNFKKYMKAMAEGIAGETIFILNYYDNIDENKANKVIGDMLVMYTSKINDVSKAFDQTPRKSFGNNIKEYRKARRAFYKSHFGGLRKEYNEGVQTILKEMNSLLSKEQLAENKKAVNE